MKILFVCNNYYATGNGLSASARRTVTYLRKAGQDVRVLSGPNHDDPKLQPDYILEDIHIPIFDKIVRAHGYKFAGINRKKIKEAVRWADVVHLEEPFFIEAATAHICHKLGKPCTGTYHLHPENMFYSVKIGWWKGINHGTMAILYRNMVFNKCSHVSCPTQNVMDRLRRFHYTAKLHLISNGVIPDTNLRPTMPPKNPDEPFSIVCIGRLAAEKDQTTLLKAMRYSKYADRIQLYFAGRGPERKRYLKMAHKLVDDGVLKYEPIFRYHTRDELRELSARADLYVHCAVVEVEGLSALEALQQGVVPIMASGPLTATSQFALDHRSTFPIRDKRALADRIDWWLDHPEEREKMSVRYAESTEQYDIRKSVQQLIEMFQLAIDGK
ncbi:MAG: glycosyltransferase [Bacteroidales bacterium]|nr:glycosyltransferase [Bacteroidales bacterium]